MNDENRDGRLDDTRDDRRNDTREETRPSSDAAETSGAERDDFGDGQVYTAADRGYAFRGSATPSGSGYTTPTGGHGYVYAPESDPEPPHGDRRVLIGICTAVGILLLMAVCVLGTVFVMRLSPGGTPEETDTRAPGPEETDTPITSGDLQIVTDPGSLLESDPAETESQAREAIPLDPEKLTEEETTPGGAETTASPTDPIPDTVTVDKKEPLRRDENGDGVADIEIDENGNVRTSAGDDVLPVATIVYRIADSVVEINTETIVQSGRIGQAISSGAGSGVVISAEGFIVTNNHVIEGADHITVRFKDGVSVEAVPVGTDERTDVAVIWVDPAALGRPLTVARLGCSFDLVAGEEILTIGNPLGSLGGTVTEGIISATAREIRIDSTDMTLIQISSPINPGNSGGGLFNLAGELVGVVNAKCSDDNVEGLGFAIPVDTAYPVILELIDHGYVRGRPTTGLTLVDVSSVNALYYFRSRYAGVYVYSSEFTDELAYGDLILTVNGKELNQAADMDILIEHMSVGDVLEIVVYRGGEKVTVSLTLREYAPTSEPADGD